MSARARDLGLPLPGEPGPHNAITDVPGVRVGLTTLLEPEGRVRTGVTAILPHPPEQGPRPVWAGLSVLNGNGEMTGAHWVRDGGYLVGPVMITNTHSVGIVHHGTVRWMIRRWAAAFGDRHLWAMPVVAETYDGVLNDINGLHVTEDHAIAAIEAAAPGPVAEGNVGGGTGMIAYEFKGGTGTASRRVETLGRQGTIGVLVQANHGRRPWFTVLGVPVGRELAEGSFRTTDQGSIIVVVATDLPALPHQLDRVARRAALGLARGGTPGGNSSGDIFLAFSTANPMPMPELAPPLWQLEALADDAFDPVYLAVVEAVEEAILNAMLAARPLVALKPAGHRVPALDGERLVAVLRRAGRL
jgi:D-aminopeptidase